MSDATNQVRTFTVWLDGWVSTRVVARDWFQALELAIPRFNVDLDPRSLLVTVAGETVHCEEVEGSRRLAVELVAA
jgi:hypothetical protein